MLVSTAIDLIRDSLVYKPGWEFEAEDGTSRFEGSVKLTIHYPCPDSNRDRAGLGYPDTEPCARLLPSGAEVPAGTPTLRPDGKARASFALMVGDVQDVRSLYHLITCAIMQIEEHEMREFLRVRPSFWAPFHPHKEDGIRSWAEVTGQEFRHVQSADLHFGLA